jgi:hypothetical protein
MDIPYLFNLARSSLGEVLSAFEVIDSHSLELLQNKNPHLVSRWPSLLTGADHHFLSRMKDQLLFDDPAAAYLIFEIQSGSTNSESQLHRSCLFLVRNQPLPQD